MSSPDPAYVVEIQHPEEAREAVLALWKSSGFWPQESDEAPRKRYEWLHLRNPAGASRMYLLKEAATGKVVGCVGACPRVFATGQQVSRGTLLVDFVVDPAHRSLFPALLLQRTVRERELAEHALVYAIPESKAVPVFKRLGNNQVVQCGRFARVVRFHHVTERVLWRPLASIVGSIIDLCYYSAMSLRLGASGLRGDWTDDFGPDVDRIWDQARANAVNLGERNAEFLRWRFLEGPGNAPARIFVIREQRGSKPRAYFVCVTHGTRASIQDFLCLGSPKDLVASLALLSRAMRRMGASIIDLEFAGDATAKEALRAAHFVQRTNRQCFVTGPAAASGPQVITRADEDV